MMFRTRDLGRWTEDGELEHFGRVDDMVKIRGFRVELDGVSRVIETTQGCQQAVTLKYDDRSLVAFVTPASWMSRPRPARLAIICLTTAFLPPFSRFPRCRSLLAANSTSACCSPWHGIISKHRLRS